MPGLETFDAAGNPVVRDTDSLFRILGYTFIPNGIVPLTGNIIHDGFTTGTPYCLRAWAGTVNNGGATSAFPPTPLVSFSGNVMTYQNLQTDWYLIYGVL